MTTTKHAPTKNTSTSSGSSSGPKSVRRFPTLRDPTYGWLNFAVLLYCVVANGGSLLLLLRATPVAQHSYFSTTTLLCLLQQLLAIVAGAHGRLLASYLVHEAAHATVFKEVYANRWFGTVCLWVAGCPYADFGHIKWMHMSHHNDRADTVEFDYRAFVNNNHSSHPMVRRLVIGLEYCFVPAVETIMHLRTAVYPIVYPLLKEATVTTTSSKGGGDSTNPSYSQETMMTASRHQSACIGTPVMILFYVYLYQHHILLPHLVMGAVVLQWLAFNDAFHHTYEAILLQDYTPGPGPRTPHYEEANTYSNLLSCRYPLVNTVSSLNFGYHNAHHSKAMTPWYNLPKLHETLYGPPYVHNSNSNNNHSQPMPQLLPVSQIGGAWVRHRLRRILEEDYGFVAPPTQPGRADHFVGTLGASFLTV